MILKLIFLIFVITALCVAGGFAMANYFDL